MYSKSVILMGLIATIVRCEERIQPRIMGGQYAHVSDFPWQLSLQENFRHICGASILSEKRALTAAHCFDDSPDDHSFLYTVVAGHEIDDIDNHIEVNSVILHPNYDNFTVQRDIAVLWLAQDLIFDYVKIRPVRLPKQNAPVVQGMKVYVSGWGRTSDDPETPHKLKWTLLKIYGTKRCEIAYPREIDADMICAGWSKGGRDSCKGDSGGALVTAGKNPKQIGIVSWGEKDGDRDVPGVYTRVSAYVDWIKSVS